jgi:hypothetical protein
MRNVTAPSKTCVGNVQFPRTPTSRLNWTVLQNVVSRGVGAYVTATKAAGDTSIRTPTAPCQCKRGRHQSKFDKRLQLRGH